MKKSKRKKNQLAASSSASQVQLTPGSPATWREKYWKPVVTTVEVGFAVGFWSGGITVTDLEIAALLFAAGFIFLSVGIWTSALNRRQKLMYLGLTLFWFVGSWGIVYARQPTPPSAPVDLALYERVNEVREFFGSAGEMDLRAKFDLDGILAANITIQAERIRHRREGRPGPFYRENYEGNGKWILLVKPGKSKFIPSGVEVDEGPKDVLYLLTTLQYQAALARLTEWMNDPILPQYLRERLSSFKDVLDKNNSLLFEILNQRLAENEDYFLKADTEDRKYSKVISTDLVTRMTSLKPAADEINDAISRALKVNR